MGRRGCVLAQRATSIPDKKLQRLVNTFTNDTARISAAWLIDLIIARGLTISKVYTVIHNGTGTRHLVVQVSGDQYLCDCCMGTNLGIPCRHFFAVFHRVPGTRFRLASVQPRWLKNPAMDLSKIPPVTQMHAVHEAILPEHHQQNLSQLRFANPLDARPPTIHFNETIRPQEAHGKASVAVRDLLATVTTRKDLDEVLQRVDDIR
jgi:hypothetical protein